MEMEIRQSLPSSSPRTSLPAVKPNSPPARGRPRSFDRDKALHSAMEVFWDLGYEGATLLDLQKAMGGITAPSFYAAFGSKQELFKEAVTLHMATVGAPGIEA